MAIPAENKNSKSNLKKLSKYFLLVYLLSFFLINWNEVSWIFNYKVVSQLTERTISAEEKKPEKGLQYSNKENSLEIPKLGISAPLILVEKKSQVQSALDRGVVLFPESSLPGNAGQTIILGHSAPSHWPKIKYNWIFSRISELKENDEIFLYFEHKKYQYLVQKKIFLERGEELPKDLTTPENLLVLISCWPPETGTKRIALVAN